MDNRRSCDICEIDIHRASYSRHLRSEKKIKNDVKNYSRMMNMMRNPDYWVDNITLSTSNGTKINLANGPSQ